MTMSTSSAPGRHRVGHVGQLDRERGPAGRERGGHRGDRDAAGGQLGLGHADQVRVDADRGDRRHRGIGRVRAQRLGAHGPDLAGRVGAFQGGQVDHPDGQVQGLQLGGLLDRPGGQARDPGLGADLVHRRQPVQDLPQRGVRGRDLAQPGLAARRRYRLDAHAHDVTRLTGAGEPWLDHRVDDLQPLVERRRRALRRVDGRPLDVGPAVAEDSLSASNSDDRLTPLISRLSVLTVTRKDSSRSSPMG